MKLTLFLSFPHAILIFSVSINFKFDSGINSKRPHQEIEDSELIQDVEKRPPRKRSKSSASKQSNHEREVNTSESTTNDTNSKLAPVSDSDKNPVSDEANCAESTLNLANSPLNKQI